MSSLDALNLVKVASTPVEALRDRLRALGARPFHQEVVHSPWSTIHDTDAIHSEIRGLIQELVSRCGQKDAVRCLTLIAPPGYGKTHLLASTRHWIEKTQCAIFAYVPPYSTDCGPYENHVLRAVLDSLRSHSPWQCNRLNQKVRETLVQAYDEYIKAGKGLGKLKAASFWTWVLRSHTLYLAGQKTADQLHALQAAFDYPNLLEEAFASFADRNPPSPQGIRCDRDVFLALAQAVCGTPAQSKPAWQWLHNEPLAEEDRQRLHLQQSCQGVDRIRNALYTLTKVLDLPLFLVFDQFEDSFRAVKQLPGSNWAPFMEFLSPLTGLPGIGLLFMVQASVMEELLDQIPRMFKDRILEGYGVQRLRTLNNAQAEALVRARMDAFVWSELEKEGITCPADQPLFPFTAEEIAELRIEANSGIRPFFRLLNARYAKRIAPTPPPTPIISKLVPAQVEPDQPTAVRIYGQHFRPGITVYLDTQEVTPVTRLPSEGTVEVLEIVTPTGLLGDIALRVVSADDPDKRATTILRFAEIVSRPYASTLDRQKFQKRRSELKLSQARLGQALGVSGPTISYFENNHSNPSDEFIERLAAELECSLKDFLPDSPEENG